MTTHGAAKVAISCAPASNTRSSSYVVIENPHLNQDADNAVDPAFIFKG